MGEKTNWCMCEDEDLQARRDVIMKKMGLGAQEAVKVGLRFGFADLEKFMDIWSITVMNEPEHIQRAYKTLLLNWPERCEEELAIIESHRAS